jgi:hypothetical protein
VSAFARVSAMITHEQFVESLGEFAEQYTPEQLEQLHRDVKVFARLVIETRQAEEQRDNAPETLESRIQELPL